MTTVVSRLYADEAAATRVADALRADGFPASTLSIVTEADAAAMASARVEAQDAQRYATAMQPGQALFVCRAPFTPFGAALRAQEAADSEPSLDAGVTNENRYIREVASLEGRAPSVYLYHPLMMTRDDYVGSGWSAWRLSDVFGFTTVSRRAARPDNLVRGHMSTRFWPGRLLSAKARKPSVMSGGRHMSRLFWPMPLVTTGTKRRILAGHPRITELFGWRTLPARP